MMRSFKVLGLALLAVFAMSAVAASVASANQFHSTATNTTLTVASNKTQAFLYETGGKTVECTTVAGSGETKAQTVTEITFKPQYSNCVVAGIGGSSAQVSMNECDYLFTIDAGANQGTTHVQCVGTSQITITVKVIGISVCTLHIGKQTPSGKSIYSNSGTTKVEVAPKQTGISGTRQGSAECGATSSTSGTYSGSVVVKGEETGQQTEKAIQVG